MSDFEIREFEILDLPGLLEPMVNEVVDGELVPTAEERCDFCLELLPRWEVPCADFVHPGTNRGSRGPWLACDACAELIRTSNREGLLDRSLIPTSGLGDVEQLRKALAFAQEGFWKHKTGDPRPT